MPKYKSDLERMKSLAGAIGKSMRKTVEKVFEKVYGHTDHEKVYPDGLVRKPKLNDSGCAANDSCRSEPCR